MPGLEAFVLSSALTRPPSAFDDRLRIRNLSDKAVEVAAGLGSCGLECQEAGQRLPCLPPVATFLGAAQATIKNWASYLKHAPLCTRSFLDACLICLYEFSLPVGTTAIYDPELVRLKQMVFGNKPLQECMPEMESKKAELKT